MGGRGDQGVRRRARAHHGLSLPDHAWSQTAAVTLAHWTTPIRRAHTGAMSQVTSDPPPVATQVAPRAALMRGLTDAGLGFAYWLGFLLLLEPGNVVRAMDAGRTLAWDREAFRIAGAAALGASATPLLMALVRRYPLQAGRLWSRIALNAVASVAVAALLVVISCLLASWWLPGETRPLTTAIRQEMTNNWPLLVYCIGTFLAAAHAVRYLRGPVSEVPTAWLTQMTVTARGKRTVVRLDSVDWIETQGNYLALHAGAETHLIRETSVRMEARLDPARFVRIHRRTLVAVDRIAEVAHLDGGDAALTLVGGAELRVSRNYRQALRDRLG